MWPCDVESGFGGQAQGGAQGERGGEESLQGEGGVAIFLQATE